MGQKAFKLSDTYRGQEKNAPKKVSRRGDALLAAGGIATLILAVSGVLYWVGYVFPALRVLP